MQLIEVNSAKTRKEFLEVPAVVFKDDPNFIRPLDQDINDVFDPAKNKLFTSGEAIRWVLKDNQGKLIGRVAAFVNEKTARTSEYVTGGMGFFDCINDQSAANTLFDACKEWLSKKGMEAMDGPINFGDRQSWWGLLTEGFTPPTYSMNYNLPYYEQLFENYGFQTYFNQFVFRYVLSMPVPELFRQKADRIFKSPAFRFEHFRKKDTRKFADDITRIYNEAWSGMGHFKPVTNDQTLAMVKKMLPIIDERIIWFGYFKDRPIAVFLMLPDINQIVRHLNGKMDLWGKIRFAYYLKRGIINKMIGVLFGVVPDFQGKGIDGALVIKAGNVVQNEDRYKDLEMNWIGDFNPKMVKMVENLGTKIYKRYRTYRKIFDPSKPFFRAPMVE